MGAAGQGSISKANRVPVAGPPFPANSAVNGLSVNGAGQIVLGNDVGATLAALLNDRQIPLDGFYLQLFQDLVNGAEFRFIGDAIESTMSLAANTGVDTSGLSASFGINPSGIVAQAFGLIDAGDFSTDENVTQLRHSQLVSLEITNPFPQGAIRAGITGGSNFLLLDLLNELYSIGDLDGLGNGNMLYIDDPNQSISLMDALGIMLNLSRGSAIYQLGDISNVSNGTKLSIDDINQRSFFDDALGEMLSLDRGNGAYIIGDISGVGNGNFFAIGDAAQTFSMGDAAGNALIFDTGTKVYRIGDVDAITNGNFFEIADATNLFKINNTANNAAVEINGVAGFTGTVTPVTSITVDGGIVTAVT